VIRRLSAIAGAVFADAVRRRIVLAVVFFAGVLVFTIPLLPSYGMGVIGAVYREFGLALVFAASLVLTLSLAANRVPGEVERRTVYNVVAKPVSRWEYLVGTWLGIVAVMALVVAAFVLVVQGFGVARYGQPMWQLWEGGLAIWCEMGVLAALSVAVSAAAGPVVVVVAALTFEFIGHSRDSLLGEGGGGVLRALYPSLDTFNIVNPVAHADGVGPVYLGAMLLAFLGWAGLLLLLGSLSFERRDL
jgi:ABC-type transport system involved in multi-copper enzyme maturation permease subunit